MNPTRECPQCGAPNLATSLFCSQCTHFLGQVGSYRLLRSIGEGGFGHVYLGQNLRTHFPVAIKVLHKQLYDNQEMQQRFEREVEILTQIRHPHVVNVFESGMLPQLGLYLVMEWLDGVTLWKHLQTQAPQGFPLEQAFALFCQLLEGLDGIHKAGVVHRDLKPQNLMLTKLESGHPILKILDFGIARPQLSQLTKAGGFLGTPYFMSPEQIQQEDAKIGPSTDLYAAGLLWVWMVTGKMMFEGSTLQEVCQKQCTVLPRSLSELSGRSFPPELEAVVARSLHKSPEGRFAHALEFLDALSQAMGRQAPAMASFASLGVSTASSEVPAPMHRSPALMSTEALESQATPSSPLTPFASPVASAPQTTPTSSHASAGSLSGARFAPQPPGAGYHPRWYVSRPEEEGAAIGHLETPGSPVVLWGPELFGKTWMVKQLASLTKQKGWRVVEVSLNQFDEESLSSLDRLLQELALLIVEELEEPEEWVTRAWKRPGNPLRKLTWLMEKRVLRSQETPLMLAIDRVDSVQGQSYCDDFFGLLRSWAEDSYQESWSRLRLMLAVSTTPTLLTERSNQSPFNLTPPIYLGDFTLEHIRELGAKYQLSWGDAEFQQIMDLVGGHPYLVRLILHAATKGDETSTLLDSRGPLFQSYLNRYRKRLQENPELAAVMTGILRQSIDQLSPTMYHRLYKAGLIISSKDGDFFPRYKIYERLLD